MVLTNFHEGIIFIHSGCRDSYKSPDIDVQSLKLIIYTGARIRHSPNENKNEPSDFRFAHRRREKNFIFTYDGRVVMIIFVHNKFQLFFIFI